MKKTFVISLVLCGCVQYSGSQSHQAENAFMTPMAEYRKCMGYSDNSITYTSDNSARYIVLSSEKSIEQPFSNNITKTYCGHFIRKSDWRAECKSKLMGVEDNM